MSNEIEIIGEPVIRGCCAGHGSRKNMAWCRDIFPLKCAEVVIPFENWMAFVKWLFKFFVSPRFAQSLLDIVPQEILECFPLAIVQIAANGNESVPLKFR